MFYHTICLVSKKKLKKRLATDYMVVLIYTYTV